MESTRCLRINMLNYFLLLLPISTLSLTFDPVVSADGSNASIYPNSRIVAKWTTITGDPERITLEILWASGATTLFATNVPSSDGSVVDTIGGIDAPAVYKLVAYNANGEGPIIGASDPFAVLASTGTPITTTPAQTSPVTSQSNTQAPTSAQDSSTTAASQTSSTSSDPSSADTTNIFTSSQSITASPSPSSNSQDQPTGKSTHKKGPIGAIVGGVVGGVVLLTTIAILVLFLLRRRRPTAVPSGPNGPTDVLSGELRSEPVILPSSARPFEKPGGPTTTNRQRDAMMLQQQDGIQSNMKSQQRRQVQSIQPSQGPSHEELLMEQNQALTDRILVLEAQRPHMETVVAHGTLPPDYTL